MSGIYKGKTRSQEDKGKKEADKRNKKTNKTDGIPLLPIPEGVELKKTHPTWRGLRQGIIVDPAAKKEYKPAESFKLKMVNDLEAKNLQQTQQPQDPVDFKVPEKKRPIVANELIKEKHPAPLTGGFRSRYY